VRKEGFRGTLQQQRVLKQIPGPPVVAPVVTALPGVVGKGGQSHVERMMVQKGIPPLQQVVLEQFLGPPMVAPVVTALQRVVGKGSRSHVERMMVQKGSPPLWQGVLK